MSKPLIKLKKTHPDAVLPSANNKDTGTGDSGYDLVAVESGKIAARGSNIIAVGLTLADITPGYWIRIEPRSGLGFKHSIQPHLGVIDNGYRGDLGVKLYNFSNTDPYYVKSGDKIAQLVVYRLIQPTFEFSDDISETPRGNKAFGSSDNKECLYNDPTGSYYNDGKLVITESHDRMSQTACDNSKTIYNDVFSHLKD